MGGVNLVVSCTKRKTREPCESLQLRKLDPAASAWERAAEWMRRLRGERSNLVTAGDLYSGDHWKVVRSIANRHGPVEQPIRIWICSAGYGLITLASQIAPYAATFTPGQPDSIVSNGHDAVKELPAWWAALGGWNGPSSSPCRSIVEVAKAYPDDFLLVALSDGYLKAVTGDLREALASQENPDQFAVICAGADTLAGLEPHLLPCDARLQPLVGGALASLNVRLALRLLECSRKDLSLTRCRALFQRWMSAQPNRISPSRSPMTDEDVGAYIQRALAANASVSPTPLLQNFRREGKACEHSRFTRLFREMKDQTNASA